MTLAIPLHEEGEMSPEDIRSDMEIRQVIASFPSTREIFARHGLETCCGGVHSIAVAALARGLDPDRVLAEIRAAAAGSA